MIKSSILAVMAVSAMLTVGGAMNTSAAMAQTAVCPPNTVCPPTAGSNGSTNPKVPSVTGNQTGQNQTGNQVGQDQRATPDWKRRHHNTNMDGNQTGLNQPGNMDWRHRHHHRFNRTDYGNYGVDIGIGVDLGGHRYGYYVSCGEAGSIVRASGFRHVRAESCSPTPYHFLATKRGRAVDVAVTRRGRIIAVSRVN